MNSYISHIRINSLKHLKDIDIAIPSNKHLIITGRNASGKTILLDALAHYLEDYKSDKIEVSVHYEGSLVFAYYNDGRNRKADLPFRIEYTDYHTQIEIKDLFSYCHNTSSSSSCSVLAIINDLKRKLFYNDTYGIVLIDDIDMHLDLQNQKDILPLLIRLFPNIQFIVTTHSPFVVNSIENAVIYDLTSKLIVNDDVGLSNIPYDGIVEGWFNVETLSEKLKEKFEKYKEIISKDHLDSEDFAEIARLEMYLDEIPDYLALGITTEYQLLQLEFEGRKDLY